MYIYYIVNLKKKNITKININKIKILVVVTKLKLKPTKY